MELDKQETETIINRTQSEKLRDTIVTKEHGQDPLKLKSRVPLESEAKPLTFTFVPIVRNLPAQIQIVDASQFLSHAKKKDNHKAINEHLNKSETTAKYFAPKRVDYKDTDATEPPFCQTDSKLHCLETKQFMSTETDMLRDGVFKAEIVYLAESDEEEEEAIARNEKRQLTSSCSTDSTSSTHPTAHSAKIQNQSTGLKESCKISQSLTGSFYQSSQMPASDTVPSKLHCHSSTLENLPTIQSPCFNVSTKNNINSSSSSNALHTECFSSPNFFSSKSETTSSVSRNTSTPSLRDFLDSSEFLNSSACSPSPCFSSRSSALSPIPLRITPHFISPSPSLFQVPPTSLSPTPSKLGLSPDQTLSRATLSKSGTKSPLSSQLSILTAVLRSGTHSSLSLASTASSRPFSPSQCHTIFPCSSPTNSLNIINSPATMYSQKSKVHLTTTKTLNCPSSEAEKRASPGKCKLTEEQPFNLSIISPSSSKSLDSFTNNEHRPSFPKLSGMYSTSGGHTSPTSSSFSSRVISPCQTSPSSLNSTRCSSPGTCSPLLQEMSSIPRLFFSTPTGQYKTPTTSCSEGVVYSFQQTSSQISSGDLSFSHTLPFAPMSASGIPKNPLTSKACAPYEKAGTPPCLDQLYSPSLSSSTPSLAQPFQQSTSTSPIANNFSCQSPFPTAHINATSCTDVVTHLSSPQLNSVLTSANYCDTDPPLLEPHCLTPIPECTANSPLPRQITQSQFLSLPKRVSAPHTVRTPSPVPDHSSPHCSISRSGTLASAQSSTFSVDNDSKTPKQYKIKSSYKVFAAIPTNTLLMEQKAIDDAAVEEMALNDGDKPLADTHSELCSPAQFRQQSEELYATIDQLLEDSLNMCCSNSAPTSLQTLADSDTPKASVKPSKAAGRETKYANLCSSASCSTESRLTKPGVIRPVIITPKSPTKSEEEEYQANPFKRYLAENSDIEIQQKPDLSSSLSYPTVHHHLYQTKLSLQGVPLSHPLPFNNLSCLTPGPYIHLSPIFSCDCHINSNIPFSLNSLYNKLVYSATKLKKSDQPGNHDNQQV
ncbi:muscular LMNA-interacting protein isoform X2 [Latimeria chalumnae]|uniref:muscular LMNA-interacting protein isoform X2 n=1 Tax=Latimeria chalumnae TaxID=7897 RepID=UPI0003C117DC|nr:PREDICTED: muscular LMNA-interacting protein isoform X3 [Latimeria chalumnae]|eukprot:XP_006007013.1 PREDICTED: muscular LMNA-interacting protein isoform X3 [Latimeria chalumnae]